MIEVGRGRLSRLAIMMALALAACGSADPVATASRCEAPSGPERSVTSNDTRSHQGCRSTKAVVAGTVKTGEGQPLESATLEIEGKGENPPEVQLLSVLTNKRGQFLISLEPGRYDITARHGGYAPEVKGAKVESEERVVLRFRLERES